MMLIENRSPEAHTVLGEINWAVYHIAYYNAKNEMVYGQ